MSKTQRVLRFSQAGQVSNTLSLTNIPVPFPASRQALVRIHASAINPSDVLNVEGRFTQTTFESHGRVPGRDFAGTVVSGPRQFEGKKVWGTGGVNGFQQDGSHAEYIVVDEEALADMEMPEGMGFEQAAACGIGFLTSATMVERAAAKKGEYVLVLGSTGAVGTAATQLLKYTCAIPIETSRRGGPGVVNITDDLDPQIQTATDGKGIVAVLDTVGEASLFKKVLEALSTGGRYVTITAGRTPDHQFTFDAFQFYRNNLSMHGINTLPISFLDSAKQLRKLKKGFEEGVLTPPASIETTDLQDEKAVIAAYEKVKAGSKAKQILVNRNAATQ